MDALTDPFAAPFMQRALAEILLLSIPAGLLGTWIVLRRLSFLSHALGAATFPGLVLSAGLAFSPWLGAAGMAAAFVGSQAALERATRLDPGVVTGIVLATATATGSVLVSDVFHSSASVDRLLFGTLLGTSDADVVRALVLALVTAVATLLLRRSLVATSYAPAAAQALGFSRARAQIALFALLGAAVVSSAAAIGGFVVAGLLVVPAATARLFVHSIGQMQRAAIALTACETTAGLWIAYRENVPPGAAIAVLATSVYVLCALARAVIARPGLRGSVAVRSLMAALLTLVLSAPAALARDASKPTIVATTTQLTDIASAVGGDRIEVKGILQPNVDPHEYEPRPSDVATAGEAKLIVTSGVGLDAWITGVLSDAGSDAPVFVAAKGLALRAGNDAEPEGDPHWWHDPRNVEAVALRLARALALVDTRGASTYAANARRYVAAVKRMDAANVALIDLVPRARRKLVTNHDAFGYFAARYGLRVVGTVLGSLSTSAKPNAKATAALIRAIRAQHVPAIFTESSINPKLERQIAQEAGVKVYADLYGDTLGPAGSTGATYLEMERWNATVISYGLRGKRLPRR